MNYKKWQPQLRLPFFIPESSRLACVITPRLSQYVENISIALNESTTYTCLLVAQHLFHLHGISIVKFITSKKQK